MLHAHNTTAAAAAAAANIKPGTPPHPEAAASQRSQRIPARRGQGNLNEADSSRLDLGTPGQLPAVPRHRFCAVFKAAHYTTGLGPLRAACEHEAAPADGSATAALPASSRPPPATLQSRRRR
eukprot:Rhum_TRINITY_DN13756_c0_g3::Rhum_TRINITY_DN13756_c0_g3_i1::g.63428::m.63428